MGDEYSETKPNKSLYMVSSIILSLVVLSSIAGTALGIWYAVDKEGFKKVFKIPEETTARAKSNPVPAPPGPTSSDTTNNPTNTGSPQGKVTRNPQEGPALFNLKYNAAKVLEVTDTGGKMVTKDGSKVLTKAYGDSRSSPVFYQEIRDLNEEKCLTIANVESRTLVWKECDATKYPTQKWFFGVSGETKLSPDKENEIKGEDGNSYYLAMNRTTQLFLGITDDDRLQLSDSTKNIHAHWHQMPRV